MLPPNDMPLIPEFNVTRTQDGRWCAAPAYTVTPSMRAYGCRDEIKAEFLSDLELLCCAERIRVSVVRAAQRETAEWLRSTLDATDG